MYIIKAWTMKHDENFKLVGDMMKKEYTGSTLKECMQKFRNESNNHDLSRYDCLHIYDVINTDEE